MSRALAFIFPGQGSQRIGMLDVLPVSDRVSAALDAAESLSGLPLRELAQHGPSSALADTRAAQPLLYVADLAWAWALEDEGVLPSYVAGHSLGELAALTFAGALTIHDGLALVVARGRIMAQVATDVPGTMAAVLGMPRDTIALVLEGIDGVWVANDNSEGQAVISGTHSGIDRATAALVAAGARKAVPLDVSGAFHCPLMAPARDDFDVLLGGVAFSRARMPVIQNTYPTPATDPDTLRARLADQITAPVRWRETMSTLVNLGVDVVIETGPGAVLTGIARRVEGLSPVGAEANGLTGVLEVVRA